MAKTNYTFIIHIAPSGDEYVDYEITTKEKRLIKEAIENCESFEDVEELEDLYERVMLAARNQLAEDIEEFGGDIDIDELEYCVDFNEE